MDAPTPRAAPDEVEGPLRALLDEVLPLDGDALDLGTGTGRVALAVAPRVGHVIGVDIDRGALEAARLFARHRGRANVAFVQADAESTDLLALHQGRPFELVTARLFLSRGLLPRVAEALAPGGTFLAEALEADHWREAGGSRFNLPLAEVRDALTALGLEVRHATVHRRVEEFDDVAAAEAHLKQRRLWAKWKQDGRWDAWRARLRAGDRTLTTAHLVVRADRPKV